VENEFKMYINPNPNKFTPYKKYQDLTLTIPSQYIYRFFGGILRMTLYGVTIIKLPSD